MGNERSNVRLGFWCLTQMRAFYFSGTLLLAAATATGLGASLLFQPLFDRGLIGRDGAVLISIVTLQLALILLRIVLTKGALDMLARAGARLGQRLAMRLYKHLQRRSLQYFLETKQADLLQLMRGDIALIDDSVGQLSGWVVIGAFEAIGMLVVIVLWQPAMALVSLIGLAVGTAITVLAARLSNNARSREIEANAGVTEHILNTFGVSGALLRVTTAKHWPMDRMATLAESYRAAVLNRRLRPHWILGGAQASGALAVSAFYLIGGYLVSGGTVSTGELIAMAAIFGQLTTAVNQLAPAFVELRDAWTRMRRIEQELANEEPGSRDEAIAEPAQIAGHFRFQDVVVRAGDAPLLKRISIDIRPSRITAITGRSGAGKTTLIFSLLRLRDCDEGRILLDGRPLETIAREDLWRHTGFMPQAAVLFRGTIRENVCVGRSIDDEAIERSCVAAGLASRIRAAPHGYNSEIGESGFLLSSGERQRLAFARAVACDPTLLILDEPTAHLDSLGEQIICRAVFERRQAGATVVVVTHSPSLLKIADDVILVDDGAIKSVGPQQIDPSQ